MWFLGVGSTRYCVQAYGDTNVAENFLSDQKVGVNQLTKSRV